MTKLNSRMSSKFTVKVDCMAMHDVLGNRDSMEEKGVNVEENMACCDWSGFH